MKTKNFIKIIALILFGTSAISLSACGKKEKEVTCTYDGEKFDWSDVKAASKYNVEIKDGSMESQKVSSNNSEYEYNVVNTSAEINITGLNSSGENVYSSSVPFKFTFLRAFEQPTYDHGVIMWNAVSSATKYLVKIGDKVESTTNTYFELNPGINNDVCVKPVLDVSKVTDGKYYTYSAPITYEIMQTPTFTSFDKSTNTLTWNSVRNAGGYYFKVELNGTTVAEQGGIGADATYYNGFSFTDSGEYIAKLSATRNNNANSYDSKYATKTIIRLAAPKNFTAEESDGAILLKWDAVEHASKYKVFLPNGNSVETNDLFYKYIPETNVDESIFNFKIYASSNELDILDSLNYATQDVVKLGIVNNVKIQGQMITWDLVDKAQGYTISVDGTEYNIDKNEYSFDGYTGSHKIKIKARGNGSTIISSEYSSIQEIYKLAQPSNLRIANGALTWDSINKATSYRIILTNGNSDANEGSYSSTTNSIIINRTDLKETKTIQVQAIGDGLTIADSLPSEVYSVYILETPIVSVSLEGITWRKVENATSYTIRIGDYEKNIPGTSLNLNEEDIQADTYSVTVTAIGDSTHFDSDESQVISVKLLSKPNISENSDLSGICWETVTSATDYQVRQDSEKPTSVGTATRNYNPSFKTSGVHTISVRAIGDGIRTVSSGWSTMQIVVKQLETPKGFTVSKEGSILKIMATEVENASGYKFKIGGVEKTSETNIFEYTINNAGDLDISVAAIGNKYKYIDSSFSGEKTITILNTPSMAKFTKEDYQTYLLTWTPVNKVVSYTIEITKTYNDGTIDTTTITVTKAEVQIDTNGVSTISAKIISNGNGSTIFSSETLNVDTIAVK